MGSTVTQFVYDRAGHLIEEADGTGAAVREYIWLDDMPVAMVDHSGASPVVYYIHSDHLGRPQKITDGSGTIVWDGVFDPFGNLASVSGSVTNLLMFPGQYYDSETQISQNWFRDYDPTLGRYFESDPIGLGGGINTYAYATGKPLTRYDPTGLVSPPPGVPYPSDKIPSDPWEWSQNLQNPRGSEFIGPKQPFGPRVRCTYSPPSKINREPYFKTTDPITREQQRYNMSGDPITPDEAHPGPSPIPLPPGLPLGLAVFLSAFFYSTPAY